MAKKILLADDSVTIQKVVELTFMDQDYEVAAVGNGDAAIAALQAGLPDLVIADVHMPGADGYAVCRTAKGLSARLPVLLLVGTFEPFEESDVAACGADGFLRKPFDSAVLFSEVERLLAAAGSAAPAAPVAVEEPSELLPALDSFDDEPVAAVDSEAGWPEVADLAVDEVEAVEEVEEVEAVIVAESSEAFMVEDSPEPDVAPPAMEVEEPAAPAWSGPGGDQLVAETTSPFEIAAPAAAAASVAPTPEEAPASSGNGSAEEELVERIARRVVELMSERVVREVAWDVIPDLAEVVIRDRIRELEADLET
jgi:CheY-like chemotaxis protein